MIALDQVTSVLLGAAVGDAFGVPFEFLSSDAIKQYSLKIMHGADEATPVVSHWGQKIPAGAWSDDTSMAVATMESIVHTQGKLDFTDIMNQFVAWWKDGKYCALQQPFGLGKTVVTALGHFENGTPALECGGTCLRDNGNGALMRIFPIALYLTSKDTSYAENWKAISSASSITHGHAISQLSCIIYCEFLAQILAGKNMAQAYYSAISLPYQDWRKNDNQWQEAIAAHSRIFSRDFVGLKPKDFTPSGYVVDTLEIALYSLLHTNSYREAMQTAVSFGYDTDTYAAITGAAAGAVYGIESIPEQWLTKLQRRDYLAQLARRFTDVVNQLTHV